MRETSRKSQNKRSENSQSSRICLPILSWSFALLLTLVFSTSGFCDGSESADRVLIEKKARRLTLYSHGQVIRTYKVALGRKPEGPKEREGDRKTPEGVYVINSRNSSSGFHLALHISYPNAADVERAKRLGVSPGGNIMIHGMKNGFGWTGRFHRWFDWTAGCIAVTDSEIDEIAALVPVGTTVEIRP